MIIIQLGSHFWGKGCQSKLDVFIMMRFLERADYLKPNKWVCTVSEHPNEDISARVSGSVYRKFPSNTNFSLFHCSKNIVTVNTNHGNSVSSAPTTKTQI